MTGGIPSIAVAVAAHKPYWMPGDPAYVPVRVGAALARGDFGYRRDDEGDGGISAGNPRYCELTALWWADRHLDADVIGLAHYRRHFAARRLGPKRGRVATGEELLAALGGGDILLPSPRRYLIETIGDHYRHAHPAEPLDAALAALGGRGPRWRAASDEVMGRTWAYTFNMLVAPRATVSRYCGWLFPLLGRVEDEVDFSGYDAYNSRVLGFLSERLLNIWVLAEGLEVETMPVVNLESQHWPRKIARFVGRKFR